MLLKCEQNSKKMRQKILIAARKYFKRRKGFDIFFEHGQWWVSIDVGDEYKYYSVVDAEGPRTIDGFDFEEI